MNCPKCGGDVWDNRTKKMDDPKWKNASDFSCKDKSCGWKGGAVVRGQPPIIAPSAPQPQSAPSEKPWDTARDAHLLELYWDSFDAVLEGVAKRKLADLFKSEALAAMVATVFIQRAKG